MPFQTKKLKKIILSLDPTQNDTTPISALPQRKSWLRLYAPNYHHLEIDTAVRSTSRNVLQITNNLHIQTGLF